MSDPSWEDLFKPTVPTSPAAPSTPSPSTPVSSPPGTGPPVPPVPMSRRAAREAARAQAAAEVPAPRTPPSPAQRRAAVPDGGVPDGAAPRRGGRWLLPLASVLLLGWSATTLVDSSSALLWPPAATAPVVALPAVVVVSLGVHRRRYVSAAVAVLAAALPWALVVGYASPGDTPAGGTDAVRVMTVGAADGAADPAAVVRAVRDLGVDVLVVTDASGMFVHEATRAGLAALVPAAYVSDASPTTDDRIAVWSRVPLSDARPLDGTTGPAMTGTLELPSGPVRFVAAHVASPGPPTFPFVRDAAAWRRDLRTVGDAAAAADGAALVVGDLRATPWHAAFRALERDSGTEDAADLLGSGLRPTWPAVGGTGLLPVDHVLVGGAADVAEVGSVAVDGTDHRGLVVEVLFAPAG